MAKVVTMGEIMLRLSTPNNEKFIPVSYTHLLLGNRNVGCGKAFAGGRKKQPPRCYHAFPVLKIIGNAMVLIRILEPASGLADLQGAGHVLYLFHRNRDSLPCEGERAALIADRDQVLSRAGRHGIVIDLQDVVRRCV